MRLWPFDAETKTVDLRHLRATDLPFNKRVHLPMPIKNTRRNSDTGSETQTVKHDKGIYSACKI